MYGVPQNLDLRQFHGDYLTQVCLGPGDIQFHFGAGSEIGVEGDWELTAPDGTVLDRAVRPPAERECYRVHVLLMAVVVGSEVDPPRSFTLLFDNGMRLTVFDNSEQYESFSIMPGDIFV
jgi:hypothetical protein